MTQAEYKQWLINEIMQRKTNNNSREQLQKNSALEHLKNYLIM